MEFKEKLVTNQNQLSKVPRIYPSWRFLYFHARQKSYSCHPPVQVCSVRVLCTSINIQECYLVATHGRSGQTALMWGINWHTHAVSHACFLFRPWQKKNESNIIWQQLKTNPSPQTMHVPFQWWLSPWLKASGTRMSDGEWNTKTEPTTRRLDQERNRWKRLSLEGGDAHHFITWIFGVEILGKQWTGSRMMGGDGRRFFVSIVPLLVSHGEFGTPHVAFARNNFFWSCTSVCFR